MTTALSIMNRAAELIGYKDPSESLSADDSSSFLAVLNSLVDAWNTSRMYVVATATVSASVSASPVSIGTAQTIATARPIRIENGWIRQDNIDYPLEWITSAEYDAIPNKADTATIPSKAFYSPTLSSGSVYLWPVPSAAVSLHVRVMTQLSEFADIATDYTLAPGYKLALEFSLAEDLAPGRRPLPPEIARKAANARRAIKLVNYEPLLIQSSDVASVGRFNIVTGA